MSDFNPGPTYRGDPGVPHANEKNFTVRCEARCGVGALAHALPAQAFMGGLWTVLGLQFCKDVIEVRPLHRRVAASHALYACVRSSSPRLRRCSPDHVMAMCEEAYKRKQRARGLPYTGKLPVRPRPRRRLNPIAFAQRPLAPPPRAWPALVCVCVGVGVGAARLQLAARRSRFAVSDATPQSPLAEDQVLPHTKAPRIVKWKLDRLW